MASYGNITYKIFQNRLQKYKEDIIDAFIARESETESERDSHDYIHESLNDISNFS